MKNLILTLTILTLTITCYSQKKDTAVKYDTVPAPPIVIMRLDSVQYNYIMEFISSFPIGNPKVQIVYQLLNGSQKNIQYIPQYGLKERKKKP